MTTKQANSVFLSCQLYNQRNRQSSSEATVNRQPSTVNRKTTIHSKKTYHPFPLHAFLEHLAIAGFEVSPAKRIKVQQVLERLGSAYLKKPEELKYLLCPIIAQNVEQQEQFYGLFDKYIEEIQEPLPIPPPPILWYQKIPYWVFFLIPLLFLLGVLAWQVTKWMETPEKPTIAFQIETPVQVGDTLIVENGSSNIGPEELMVWEYLDEAGTVERRDTYDRDDPWVQEKIQAGVNPHKLLRLTLLNTPDDSVYTYEAKFTIECVQKPQATKENGNWLDTILINTPVVFKLQNTDATVHGYAWAIDETPKPSLLDSLSHTFRDQGFYTIKATIQQKEAVGFCEQVIKHTITVRKNEEIAPLEEKPLQRIADKKVARFTNYYWALLTLLGIMPLLYLAYLWWKYQQQQQSKKQTSEEFHQIFAAPDKPPYFIPFRSQQHHIHAGKDLYDFANTLRRRQEGLRKELNVEKSLLATLEKGGFPSIKEDLATQPSEYLFLIDKQHRDSLQSRLFEFLVSFLNSKDVYAERYFYSKEPFSIWQKKDRESLTLKQLHSLYPYHRLIVMGDAHLWLSQQGADAKKIKEPYTRWLARWKHRVLLTPVPPVSWTYEEAGLHQWLPIFPADQAGIDQAFEALQEKEDEDRVIHFKNWKRNQLEDRSEPTINYRKWRKVAELKSYLKDYPSLWTWLYALSVHPAISWDLTLAIGHALESEGVVVNFDNLLLLARIPWLPQGGFPPKLRLQLLEELSPTAERIARQTVQQELSAIENLTHNSFVNFEVQAGKAVQSFLLDPENKSHQDAIRALTSGKKPAIGKHRFKELDQQIKKYQVLNGQEATGIQTFLTKVGEAIEEQPLPTANPYFKWLVATSLFWLALFATSLALDKRPTLYNWTFGNQEALSKKEAERERFLIKKVPLSTSTMADLNNQAVLFYEEKDDKNCDLKVDSVALLLDNALLEKGSPEETEIVNSNLTHLLYNRGVHCYQQYFEVIPSDSTKLGMAKVFFQQTKDSLFYEAWHGEGLTDWYLKDTIRADSIYRIIKNNYLDTLGRVPNLKTLLESDSISRVSSQTAWKGKIIDATTLQSIEGVNISGREIVPTTSNKEGTYFLEWKNEKTTPVSLRLIFQKEGYQRKSTELILTNTRQLETVVLEKIAKASKKEQNNTNQVPLNNKQQSTEPLVDSNTALKDSINLEIEKLVRNAPKESRFLWCLDNAHGKLTAGKRSPQLPNGKILYEYEFNRDIVRRIINILKRTSVQYYNVVPEVEVDNFLAGRVLRANNYPSKKEKIFVSINCNAGPGTWTSISGIETWYFHGSRTGRRLATIFQKYLTAETDWENRGIKSKPDQQFYTLRNTNMVSIVTESGFYNNREQLPLLMSDLYRNKIALAHVKAIFEIEKNGLSTNYLTDPRDGQTYNTIQIGEQTWMAENLNFETPDSWCYLELEELCQKAGRLYTWEAAIKACPVGWHLPSDEEWTILLDNYGGVGPDAYLQLIEKGDSGFDALLGGIRKSNGEYIDLEWYCDFWSNSKRNANKSWSYGFDRDKVERSNYDKELGFSVRCLKD